MRIPNQEENLFPLQTQNPIEFPFSFFLSPHSSHFSIIKNGYFTSGSHEYAFSLFFLYQYAFSLFFPYHSLFTASYSNYNNSLFILLHFLPSKKWLQVRENCCPWKEALTLSLSYSLNFLIYDYDPRYTFLPLISNQLSPSLSLCLISMEEGDGKENGREKHEREWEMKMVNVKPDHYTILNSIVFAWCDSYTYRY